MNEEYLIPADYGEDEFTEKRSRFIGRVWPVTTQQEAIARIEETRERHRDATHNVYAYLIREGQYMRYSDDGEPQGTGGMPVLEVFRREKLTDFCCVVTRYFGGVLLGAGGLTRAYAKGAKIALDSAGIAAMCKFTRFAFHCGYDRFELIKRLCEAEDCAFVSVDYGADISVIGEIEAEKYERFTVKLIELTAGRVSPTPSGTVFKGKPFRRTPHEK